MPLSPVQFVQKTYSILTDQTDLSPHNHIVNATLSHFVNCLSHYHSAGLGEALARIEELTHERQELPQLCAHAECEMEFYWAKRFLAKALLSTDDLTEFWYHDNYVALWNLEEHLIGPNQSNRHVFLGSGPLPLTAIIAALKNPDLHIDCVDYNAEACALSDQLIHKIGLQKQISVIHAKAEEYRYQPTDFVICASLIDDKTSVYHALNTAGVPDFIVRDAESAYCYLYKPSVLPDKKMYMELRRTIPNKHCINTTRYFTRAA